MSSYASDSMMFRPRSSPGGLPSAARSTPQQPKRANRKGLPASMTQAELGVARQLRQTASGHALPGRMLPPAADGPVVLGGLGGQAAVSNAARRRAAAMRHAHSQQALQSPYNHQVNAGAKQRASSAARFRSDALQLEVKLAEGLQALQQAKMKAQAQGGGGHHRQMHQRLQLFRSLWDKVNERDAAFGVLLRRIKAEYEAALQQALAPPAPGEAANLRQEALEMKELLQRAAQREARLTEQLEAYEARLYEQQRQLEQQGALLAQRRMYEQQDEEDEEALAAEVAAQLAEEMPASARPGSITPCLGSGRLASIPPPPPKPACIAALDMALVAAAREAEARAEAEAAAEDAEAAAAEAEAAEA